MQSKLIFKRKNTFQQLIDLNMSTLLLKANAEQYGFRTDVLSKKKKVLEYKTKK